MEKIFDIIQNARIVKTNDLKNYLEKKRKENKSNIREEVE